VQTVDDSRRGDRPLADQSLGPEPGAHADRGPSKADYETEGSAASHGVNHWIGFTPPVTIEVVTLRSFSLTSRLPLSSCFLVRFRSHRQLWPRGELAAFRVRGGGMRVSGGVAPGYYMNPLRGLGGQCRTLSRKTNVAFICILSADVLIVVGEKTGKKLDRCGLYV